MFNVCVCTGLSIEVLFRVQTQKISTTGVALLPLNVAVDVELLRKCSNEEEWFLLHWKFRD